MNNEKPSLCNVEVNINSCEEVNICNCEKTKKGAAPSAFRAVNATAVQNVTANAIVSVLYPNKIFDLNNEYDPVTSTFTPKQDGVYSIIASLGFEPADRTINYRILAIIRVNGIIVVADNDILVASPFDSATTVSAILQLSAGDVVSVSALINMNGVFLTAPIAMHFEAARLPSPVINAPSTNNLTLGLDIFAIGEF